MINAMKAIRGGFYLAGAIEKSSDHGKGVRVALIELFKDTPYHMINPCDFEYNQSEYPTMWSFQRDPKNDFESCILYSERIADGDVLTVSQCRAVIAILDKNCGPGTSGEVTVARVLGIPVLGIFTKGTDWREVHPWILSRVKKFFDSPEALKKYICETYQP